MININSSTHAFQAEKSENISRSKKIDEIKEMHKESQAAQFAQMMSEVQSFVNIKSSEDSFEVQYQDFKDFLSDIGYEGKNIADLSQEEATELVSEEGFFGVTQTSERISAFVISGAGGDEEMLREGRKGVLQGFDEAEKMWGGKLPDIAYETISKAVEMIDKALVDGGFSVLDEKA